MGKRSDFERRAHDKYKTPRAPIAVLNKHLEPGTVYAEPCAGNGALIRNMEWFGHECAYASDLFPERRWIEKRDALTLDKAWRRKAGADLFVTNPPWTRSVLHALIGHLPTLLPTWLLYDADWKHTVQANQYLDGCKLIVSVGRVKWMQDSKGVGVDNSAWYYFPGHHTGGPKFVGLG